MDPQILLAVSKPMKILSCTHRPTFTKKKDDSEGEAKSPEGRAESPEGEIESQWSLLPRLVTQCSLPGWIEKLVWISDSFLPPISLPF